MKVADILRNLADQIEVKTSEMAVDASAQRDQLDTVAANAIAQQSALQVMQKAEPTPEPQVVSVKNFDNTDVNTMVPPLQQEYEMLKKEYGMEQPAEPCQSAEPDLLAMLKLAGIGEPQQDLNVAETLAPVDINPKKNAIKLHFGKK